MRKQKGLSLIELLIAIALGLVLIAGVIQMFVSSRGVFSTQQAISRVQESGRLAVEFMAEDIRLAGYMGCVDRETVLANDLSNGFWNDYTVNRPTGRARFVEGYTSANVPAGLVLNPAPVANSDVIVIRYAGGAPHITTQENAPGEIKVAAAGVVPALNCANGLCNGASLLVSNCVGARIFTASNVAWAADVTTVTHAGAWPTRVSPTHTFYAGSEVLPINTIVYYIGLNPGGRPSLYRLENAGQALELLEGVERMSLNYGLDTDIPVDGFANEYRPAGDIGGNQWLNVVSVNAQFLVQGNENNVVESPQGYNFAGEDVAGPPDRRLRQVFSSTVAIRSRAD